MLLNFDDKRLRSSLAVWREALAVGRPALQGGGTKERAVSLTKLDHMVAGCPAVFHSCTSSDRDIGAMRDLREELEAMRAWIAEGRCALEMMSHAQEHVRCPTYPWKAKTERWSGHR